MLTTTILLSALRLILEGYRIYPKYSETLTAYHTCPELANPHYCLLLHLIKALIALVGRLSLSVGWINGT